MSSAVSKTSINAPGERLRADNLSDDGLRQLDAYRGTFADAYESIISAVRGLGHLRPSHKIDTRDSRQTRSRAQGAA